MKNLGERLKWVLDEKSFSEEKAGSLIGVSKQSVNDVVRGFTKKPRWLYDMSDRLGVNYNWLLKGEGEVWNNKVSGDDSDRRSDIDLQELLVKIEERWKAENDMLKERLRIQDERIEKQDRLIELFSNKHLKFEATGHEPLNDGPKTVKLHAEQKDTKVVELHPELEGERRRTA